MKGFAVSKITILNVSLPYMLHHLRNIRRKKNEQDLIQLCKAKLLNILNDDGVCILNVKPTFYYISAYKNLDFTLCKFLHGFL